MYSLYRSRHVLSWLPALAAAGWMLWMNQQAALKVQPRYDESTMELVLAPPAPERPAEPEPEPEPQPMPEPEPQPEPEPVPQPEPDPVPAPEPIAESPPPKPKPKPVVQPKPAPKPKAVVASQPKAPPRSQPAPAARPLAAAPRAPAPSNAANAGALESSYLQALRHDLEQRKRYPTGRQASLERPEGNVEIWLEVDRSGRVIASGITSKARSMLLNRAASSSLQSISQLKPFPEGAFAGQSRKRFTATFNYQAP